MMDRPNVGVMECCRVCIQPSQGMMPIFSSFSLASKLMWVCQLKISEGDGLPSYICYSCNQRLNDAFQFKELCLTSDVQLRKYGVVEGGADIPSHSENGGEGGEEDPVEVKVKWSQPKTKTFSCEICSVTFTRRAAFISHMRLHMTDESGDEPANGEGSSTVDVNPFACSVCGGSYRSRESFVAHVKLHRNGGSEGGSEASFSCAICHAAFRMRQGFIAHVGQYHGRGGDVVKTEMIEGRVELGSGEEGRGKEYTCAICDAVYPDRASFVRHIRLHTIDKRFPCVDCRGRFSSLSDLKRHRRRHTGERPYACTECTKTFARQDHLAKHARTHSGVRPFTCGECDRSFAEKKTLASHLRSHRGERAYACTQCTKAFARRSNWAAHVRSHTSELPSLVIV